VSLTSAQYLSTNLTFHRWSAAPSSPYDTGRPPGVIPGSGGRRSLRPQDWDLREPARQHGELLEEMGSDEDDGQGVYLDPNGYPYRDPRQRVFAGDELYFTGHDLGQHRREIYPNAYYGEEDSEDDGYYRGAAAYNGRDEALAQSAYERIAKARANGQTNINLSVEEMEALERRRGVQQLAPMQPPPLQIASPPATPVKTPKGKSSSRNNSSVSLSSQKGKKKSSSLFGSSSPAKSKSKSGRKMSVSSDQAAPYSPVGLPPGYVAGPNGMPMPMPMPMYAPMPYYPPPSPELARAQETRDRSRSTSKHNRRASTPPEPVYAQYPPRFYPPPGGMRPGSSSSNRSYQDEADWYAHAAAAQPPHQPTSRSRAGSSAQYRMPDDYAGPPMPASQGRRSLGGNGSVDINYSSLRRIPPGSSPLAARPGAPPMHHYSDPAAASRKGSGLSQEVDSASSTSGSSSDDQGVQVDVVADPRGHNGYTVGKTTTKGSDVRRRKSRR
jgi:hypothetical protein